jgi:SpoIID/LytB domain protein
MVSGGNVSLYQGSTQIATGSSVYIGQTGGTAAGNTISISNELYGVRSYLGDMCFSVSNGNLQLVNYLDLEQYLYGVVPYEMSDSWPLEALKAQAVAARNYAAKRMGGTGSYDITDLSSQDQVYKGYSASAANAKAAVDATAGQVLTYGGGIIDAYYSASNGGWTDLPYHRWGGGADWPYYTVAQDTYDTANPANKHFETIYLPASGLETSLGVYTATTSDGYSDTEPNAANAILYIKQCIVNSGQLAGVASVNDFLLTGVTNFYTTEPFDVTYDSTGKITRDHSRTQDLNNDGVPDPNLCMDKTGAAGTFTVLVGGTSYTVTIGGMDLNNLDASGTTYRAFFASLSLMVIEPVYDVSSALTGFNLSQRRYGHALGLSQRGAQQRANSGHTYDQILAFYYPNTALTTLHLKNPIYAVNGVTMNCAAANLAQGGTLTLTATVLPSTALDKTVTWTSDAEAVATVSGGVVSGIAPGTATITATTADGGFKATCIVTVKAGVIVSPVYSVNSWLVSGVRKNTTVAQFIAGFGNDPASLHVYRADGTELTDGAVGTGMSIVLMKDGAEADRLAIIVKGDVNGDGNISISDYTLERYEILDLKPLNGVYLAAGDVNGDGNVSISDYTLIRYDILGLKAIS